MIIFYNTILDYSTGIKKVSTVANIWALNLIVFDTDYVSFVRLVMNAFEFEIVTLVLLEFIGNYFKICKSELAYKQAFTFVPVEKVSLDVDFDVMSTVFIALDFNSTNLIYSEIVLLNVNNARDVFVYTIWEPSNI